MTAPGPHAPRGNSRAQHLAFIESDTIDLPPPDRPGATSGLDLTVAWGIHPNYIFGGIELQLLRRLWLQEYIALGLPTHQALEAVSGIVAQQQIGCRVAAEGASLRDGPLGVSPPGMLLPKLIHVPITCFIGGELVRVALKDPLWLHTDAVLW